MINKNNFFSLGLLILCLLLGVGYATVIVVSVNLKGSATVKDTELRVDIESVIDSSTGNALVTHTMKQHDREDQFTINDIVLNEEVTITYTIANHETDVDAIVEEKVEVTNSNEDYFDITYSLVNPTVLRNDTTTLVVVVKLIKTPVSLNGGSATFNLSFSAKPYRTSYSGGGGTTEFQLATPQVSISSSLLSISAVEDATSYEVYNGDTLLTTTNSLSVDLSKYINVVGEHNIRIRAIGEDSQSNFAEVFYVFEQVSGLYQTGTNYTVLLKTWDFLVRAGYIDIYNDTVVMSADSDALVGDLLIDDSITKFSNNAFSACTNLTGVIIPDSITTISYGAFNSCHKLENVSIPDTVIVLESYAFANCSSLKNISLPGNVTKIGEFAFNYCVNLSAIIFNGTSKQWNSISFGRLWRQNVFNLYIWCTDTILYYS